MNGTRRERKREDCGPAGLSPKRESWKIVGANLCVRPHESGQTHRSAPTLGFGRQTEATTGQRKEKRATYPVTPATRRVLRMLNLRPLPSIL
jgi:hypothetical protein